MIEKHTAKETKEMILELLGSINCNGMDELIGYLKESSYFVDPASAYYHNNFPGGLADHSLKVYTIFNELCKMHNVDFPRESIIISALLHDACKIGNYRIDSKNVKTDCGWQKTFCYGFNEETMIMNHGNLSVYRVMKYMDLTNNEAMCISHHMGVYSQDKSVWNEFNKASKLCPAVLLLHQADMQSAVLYEKTYERGEIPFIDKYGKIDLDI